MTTALNVWSLAGAILIALGGGGAIVFILSSWLGKVWATRIADAERARFAKDLEGYKSELQQLAEERRDAVTRKRDIYGKLVAAMRVFHAGARPASGDEKREFMYAYDQVALWGSEDVVQSVGRFVDAIAKNTTAPGSVTNAELKDDYRDCINAMRRDCGFPDTTFNYRVVTFG